MTIETEGELGEMECALLDCMTDAGVDSDVLIETLHTTLYPGVAGRDAKTKQQYVGSCVSRLNIKLLGHRIVPGKLKRTYRLQAYKA